MSDTINDDAVDSEDEDYMFEIPAAAVFAAGALLGAGCVMVYSKVKTRMQDKIESAKLAHTTKKIEKELDTKK